MRWRFWALAVVSAMLAACQQPVVPQDHFYRLQVAPPAHTLATPRLKGTVEVERFIAEGVVGQRPIAFVGSDRPLEVQQYHYHYWSEGPTTLLADQLVAFLRAANVASAVVTPDLRTRPEYTIAGKILRLEQVLGQGPPKVAVQVELSLSHASDNRLLLLRSYRLEEPAADDGITAAVTALDTALGTIFGQFVGDVAGVI